MGASTNRAMRDRRAAIRATWATLLGASRSAVAAPRASQIVEHFEMDCDFTGDDTVEEGRRVADYTLQNLGQRW